MDENLRDLEQAGMEALRSGDLRAYQDTLEAGAYARVKLKEYDLAADYMAQWVLIEYSAPHFGSFINDMENSGKPVPPWHISGGFGSRDLPGKIVNLLRTIPDFENRISTVLSENIPLLCRVFHCEKPEFDIMKKVEADCVSFDVFKRERDKHK